MWELPWVEAPAMERDAGRTETLLSARYGGRWNLGDRLSVTRHSITYRALEVEAIRARLRAGEELAEGREAGWFGKTDREGLAVSSLVRKVLDG